MRGIDPHTGLTVSGADQAKQRIIKAITTELGTRKKRRDVGGKVRALFGLTTRRNQLLIVNRIYRMFANPANDLLDIEPTHVSVDIINAGFRIVIKFTYNNQQETLTYDNA